MAPPKLASSTAGSVNGRIQQDAQATAASPDIAAAPTTLLSGATGTLAFALQPQPGESSVGRVQTTAFSVTLM